MRKGFIMSYYNKVILMGNVTREVMVKTLPSGQKVTDIGLAINRTYTQEGVKKEDTTFVDITFWGRQAEILEQYLQKGRQLFVEGRLKYDSWTDPDGGKRSKLRVHGESFQFIGPRDGAPQGASTPSHQPRAASSNAPASAPASSPAAASPSNYEPSYDDFDSISDEEIPF